ncbi:tagatose-bisphosphate aldolase [Vagococcus lutrae]|uniref:tagatose-bisphosphate aldolase n=1 Tax=Vagococcus lutrae TaxID=81947 RepID=UPI000F86BD03|nr:tagatose-bisphosphate aldolase [Vagococcus lutrae]RST93400.1 tagatose-bisphosphate aldolase [Vagococcus lutrae]
MLLSKNKRQHMENLSTKDGVIAALAIDQRGALKKMLNKEQYTGDEDCAITEFKKLVSKELTPYSSSILLDPEYGIPASQLRNSKAGLIVAYEKTGYDTSESGRFPDLIDDISVYRLKEMGADAVKFLLYYNSDDNDKINQRKHAFVERIGLECVGADLPFYLELLSYDNEITDNNSKEFAKIKPNKVINMMKEFSKERYHVDVLKVEVPVNMNFVEGFTNRDDVVYSKEEALEHFRNQSMSTHLPFIFLSAGVSADLFQKTLYFAAEANSEFNGVLCGRATWQNGLPAYVRGGEEEATEWLKTEGRKNIEDLNKAVFETASSWHSKFK